MKIMAVGLNHKSAPIEIRERVFFSPAQTSNALILLKDKFADAEFVLLSTCNRLEVPCREIMETMAKKDSPNETVRLVRSIVTQMEKISSEYEE